MGQSRRVRKLKVGDVIYRVYESWGDTIEVEHATIARVTAEYYWFEGHTGLAFHCRTRIPITAGAIYLTPREAVIAEVRALRRQRIRASVELHRMERFLKTLRV